MAKYRKKPVVVEAIQWNGENTEEVYQFAKPFVSYQTINATIPQMAIDTLEGKMVVSQFDYVIKGIQGEFYPCKPDIFEATYEKI